MKIAFGCDHRGFQFSPEIVKFLTGAGHEVINAGTNSSVSTDYPLYGEKVGRLVAGGECELGVLVCGTGFGISLSANAVSGVRAVCCSDSYTAEYARRHNNANVISVGACVVGVERALMLIDRFINTPFEGGRHARRVAMLDGIALRSSSITGKARTISIGGRTLRYLNQRSPLWSHLYEYQGSGSTLSRAGCGIFSTCHALEYLCGARLDPEELADFSVSVGGRGEDGTDRPMLLKGMVEAGMDVKYGFEYRLDGHLNDHQALWDCLSGGGAALANIRSGHIVALLGARTADDGERQALVVDCHSESADERVRDRVREILPGSEVCWPATNAQGLMTGVNAAFGAFWAPLDMARDFDLLYKRG